MAYADPGAGHYDEIHRKRVVSNLYRRAQSLGFILQPISGDPQPAVS